MNNRYEVLRIYGKSKRIGYWPTDEELSQMTWKEQARATRECQRAVNYTDYTFIDGKLDHTADGSEDFSISRASNTLTYHRIYAWLGEYNKGGYRKWEEVTGITTSKDASPRLIRLWAAETLIDADDIQVRNR